MRSELGQYEFLRDPAEHTLGGTDRKCAKHQAYASIRLRIVQVGEGAGGQTPTKARIVRLQPAIVSSADKWTEQCVFQAGVRAACALIEVPRILV